MNDLDQEELYFFRKSIYKQTAGSARSDLSIFSNLEKFKSVWQFFTVNTPSIWQHLNVLWQFLC